jgi:ATP-dependent helicase/nuclease subunit A
LRGALPADRAELSRALLRSVYDHGFARTLELWFEKLQQATALDAFSLSRMEELLSAAHRFDLTGGKDCTEFVAYVESYTSADIPAQGSVRVMTIHRSKGLDFDLVLLPELQEHGGITTLGGSEVSAAFRREPGGAIDWVLSLPKQKVCVTDPVLTAHLQRRMEGDCFEALCVLYVALTRAKRAVYLITSVTGEQTVQLSTVLTRALAAEVATVADFDGSPAELLYADGTPDWYAEQPPQPAAAATGEITVTPEAMPPATAAGLRPRFGRALPSRTEEAPASAATLFLPHSSGARRFGTLMHALFQELDWLDTEPPKDILLRWRERQNPPPDLAHQMEAVFLGVLRKPQLQPLLRKPVQRYDLWREQPFEIILDGDWVSGAFDRVVVLRDGSGNVTSAQILDFKSDWVETEAKIGEATARYRPQIELYRRVLRRLLRLPPRTPVQAVLLFTHPGVAVSLAEK